MPVISIIRFFRGTVRFSIRDGFLERFINLCAQNRVPVWNGRREGNRYSACTTLAGSRRLPELAQKAGVILEPGQQGGVPVLLRRYHKRTGLFAGTALVLVGMMILGSFIWQVEVEGLQTNPLRRRRSAPPWRSWGYTRGFSAGISTPGRWSAGSLSVWIRPPGWR